MQLAVAEHDPKQGEPTKENPYYCPDVMVQAAARLRGAGAQFLRATGEATPAYTGALDAASPEPDEEALEDLLAAARAEIAAAIKKAD